MRCTIIHTMPTLQQLNIVDTKTQEKLSTGGSGGIKKRKQHPSSSSTAANNEQVKSPHNTKKKHWSPPKPKSNSTTNTNTHHYAPIKTPSALLSRNPTQLSTSLQTSLTTIKSIRNNAAIEIINNEYIGHGKLSEEIINCVSRYCIANHNDDVQQQQTNKRRPTALLAGAVTALDLCARELLLKSIPKSSTLHGNGTANNISLRRGHRNDCIRTGSKSIDQLLSPDSSYTSFDQGWTISYPYKIPSSNYEAVEQHTTNNTSHPSSSQTHSNNGGVPFGMVTELSGPPSSGKTQLALSIAAHAVLTNQMDVHYISGGNSTKALSRRLFSIFLELARSSVVVQYQQQPNGGSSGGGDVSSSMTYEMEEEAKSVALKALDRVHVASVPDAYSLLAMLARIDNEEKSSRMDSGSSNIGKARKEGEGGTLLVVDSISGCLGHHLSSEGGAALANQVALTLRHLARVHDGHILDSSVSSSSGVDPSTDTTLSARRFAVIVTNGSVAKYSLDNKEPPVGSSSTTKATTSTSGGNQTQNKPAMGRYWHVSDVGIWLEEDKSAAQYQQLQQLSINFYDDTSVVGLALAEKKVVCATLQNHYGKSCRSRVNSVGQMNDKLFAKFRIRGGGIDDLES